MRARVIKIAVALFVAAGIVAASPVAAFADMSWG